MLTLVDRECVVEWFQQALDLLRPAYRGIEPLVHLGVAYTRTVRHMTSPKTTH